MSSFQTNWQRLGLKSPQEGAVRAFRALYENRKKILSKGASDETPIMWGNKVFRLTKKGFKVG